LFTFSPQTVSSFLLEPPHSATCPLSSFSEYGAVNDCYIFFLPSIPLHSLDGLLPDLRAHGLWRSKHARSESGRGFDSTRFVWLFPQHFLLLGPPHSFRHFPRPRRNRFWFVVFHDAQWTARLLPPSALCFFFRVTRCGSVTFPIASHRMRSVSDSSKILAVL